MSLLAGRYELVARIGVGGYGEVWRGTDSVLARPVAIKLLQAEHTVQPEAMMRFRAEARHAGALSHPCIAHVYDYCEPAAPDPPFLVMELVDGMSLAEVLTRGPMDVVRAMDVIGQAAAGLYAAHQAGLVHRDIKPGNLLISRAGPVKITDFGIAQAQVPAASGPVTMTGMVLGTAGYMAPERVEGNQATVASDLYALGVVAWECLAGLLPRGGLAARSGDPTLDQPAIAPRTAPLPPLPASIPADVAGLVSRLTARDPARRPASAGEVARQAAALRDRYRDAAARPGAAAGPARDAAADDTAWDNAVEDDSAREGSPRDRTAVDGAARNGAGPDRTAADAAVRGGAVLTERSPAGQEPATGPDAAPARRKGGPGGRVRPSRMVLAIVVAALTGLALLTFGVLEVIHQRGAPG
ncbi:MAG TPA: serine/threonine-protein kinase, partial [Streptosporangiaceae bacterium]|nr:serine/threonine-protein kinase [Streptosporangiaceae bacterium]